MAANNMSNIHGSPDVVSTSMLLQQGKLQQQILHGISRASCQEVFCKKATLKTSHAGKAFRPATLLKRDSNNTGVFL